MERKHLYIALAILGFVLPWMHYVGFIQINGLNIPLFIASIFANGPATGFAADVLWATLVFWIWTYFDSKENDLPNWWVSLVLGACVGLSVALPVYLLMREQAQSSRQAPIGATS